MHLADVPGLRVGKGRMAAVVRRLLIGSLRHSVEPSTHPWPWMQKASSYASVHYCLSRKSWSMSPKILFFFLRLVRNGSRVAKINCCLSAVVEVEM